MAQHQVIVCCWKHCHQTELVMTRRQEDTLADKITRLKAVCPACRDQELGNQPIFILKGETLFNPGKVYKCYHGHVSQISAFVSGMINITFGNDSGEFVNVEGSIRELAELIDKKEVSCHHVKEDGRVCGCKLKETDDFTLAYPDVPGIKTKTRLGDLWDKAGAEPVRSGGYGKDGHYEGTRSEDANKARIKNMQRKRNIAESRGPARKNKK